MTKQKFIVPNNHTLEEILGFSNLLSSYVGSANEVVFDFQPAKGYSTPFGMLYIGFAIRKFIQSHPEAKVSAINFEKHDYVAHMATSNAVALMSASFPVKPKAVRPICQLRS